MSNWKMVRLGDVATYVNGFAFKPSDWKEHGIPIIRIQNLNDNDASFNFYNQAINEKYIVNNDDVLISWSASLGVYKWNRDNALLNQHIFKVIFDKMDVDKNYFIYAIQRLLVDMERQSHGSTMKHITKPKFDNMLFPLPPLEKQKQIAEILDITTEIISINKKRLEELESLSKSIFYKMFGDPVTNEKRWNKKNLGEVCLKITDGKHGDCMDEANSGFYFISAKDINNGQIYYKNARQITKLDYENTNKRTKLTDGDIVVVNTGATIGKAALVSDYEVEMNTTFQKSVAIITVNKLELINKFLLSYMTIMRDDIYQNASGSAQKNWLLSQMRSYTVIIPSIKIQNEFSNIITKIEEEKSLVKQSIVESENLLISLMNQYFD